MRMRTLLLIGTAWLLGACGDSDSDDDTDVIRTDEMCTVDSDCKMDPGRASSCKDALTLVRYDVPRCGANRRCEWPRLEERCGHSCEDGFCITAGR
jgi:hypothetical protein